MMLRKGWTGFVAGFACALMLVGGAAAAAGYYQKQIQVTYLPLKYFFDGAEKAPPSDQQGFVYEGRTYVPLRFMGEALGRQVDYDPETYSIYVGRRPSPLPAEWAEYQTRGQAVVKLDYYEEGAQDLRGVEVPKALLASALTMKLDAPTAPVIPTAEIAVELALPAGAKEVTGRLFAPVHYFGHSGSRRVGYLVVLDAMNQSIYRTDVVTTDMQATAFKIPVDGRQNLKLVFVLYPNEGVPVNDSMIGAQLGIADFDIQ